MTATTDSPTPRTINWAILGTGSIANDMVQILHQLPNTTVLAIGSRSPSSAQSFGSKWNIPRRVSYAEACSDPDVDVVYIATPSMRHPDDCRMALQHRKAILCEKSMAPDHIVAKQILDAAKSANCLCVHGVWSRFFPAMTKIRQIIHSGEIGEVRSARASFCQNDGAGSCSALAETGIYCAQFLQWVLGEDASNYCASADEKNGGGIGPVVKGATQTLHESGFDEHVTAIIEFPGKKIGTFECSLAHTSERSATVYGTLGVINVPFPFWCSTQVTVTKMTGLGSQQWSEPQVYEFPLPSEIVPLSTSEEVEGRPQTPGFNFVNSQGLAYEAAEVNRCFRGGLIETPLFSTAQCIEVLRIIADIREYASKGMS
ncbi:hypothetical protein HJC23_011958 [Cyclotella cryptica]|uniref:D-xylose 1-dehydrogenase (NADP(+), D-xylono-1,5-lactone-forming) n=1 Tax=Cyclotella cryptica TaxID=29204 RepID=A0ABD3QRH4_9STRA|eukprot:CCRYP_003007-RA/>CCRYP_003007-RA protein AED:0.02 eAED:0.02 QI:107/1/1/1/1/1/2/374/372